MAILSLKLRTRFFTHMKFSLNGRILLLSQSWDLCVIDYLHLPTKFKDFRSIKILIILWSLPLPTINIAQTFVTDETIINWKINWKDQDTGNSTHLSAWIIHIKTYECCSLQIEIRPDARKYLHLPRKLSYWTNKIYKPSFSSNIFS